MEKPIFEDSFGLEPVAARKTVANFKQVFREPSLNSAQPRLIIALLSRNRVRRGERERRIALLLARLIGQPYCTISKITAITLLDIERSLARIAGTLRSNSAQRLSVESELGLAETNPIRM